MALKNKNGGKIVGGNNKKPVVINNIENDTTKSEQVVVSETKNIPETSTVKTDVQKDILSLKKALLSVYNKLRVYVSRTYVNYEQSNFTESDNLLGFKHEKENVTIKVELIDINGNLYNEDNVRVIITKDNKDFNDYVLLEKTKLENSNRVVFQTIQSNSCTFQIKFILTLEDDEIVEYVKEVKYITYNRVYVGYFDRHSKKYITLVNNDVLPTNTCKGNSYEIKFYDLPLTKENHGERICLYIPHDLYINDEGNYSFYYNGFQIPLFLEEEININNEKYYVFVSTSYYENDNNEIYDFSIKIEVV